MRENWPEYPDGLGVDTIRELYESAKQLLAANPSHAYLASHSRLAAAVEAMRREVTDD